MGIFFRDPQIDRIEAVVDGIAHALSVILRGSDLPDSAALMLCLDTPIRSASTAGRRTARTRRRRH